MITLKNTTQSLEFKLGSAVTTTELDFTCSYADDTVADNILSETNGTSNGTTSVTLAAAPAASTQRQIKWITITNLDSVAATVKIQFNDNSTIRHLAMITLDPGDTLQFIDPVGFNVLTSTGAIKHVVLTVTNMTLTGDVTGSGTGTVPTTIGPNKVTLAMMDTIDTATILGRQTAGVGNVEDITIDDLKTMLNVSGSTSGTNTGDQTVTLTGDVTGSGTSSFSTTIGANKVLTSMIANSNVTLAKIANISDQTILGNNTGGSSAPLALSSSQVKTILSLNNVENTALSTWAGSSNLITAGLLVLSGNPSASLGAATKQYVDAVASGLDLKASVRVATTVNITLSGTQTIDGISVIAGNRVLVKNQSTASENGIYVCASGSWTRATDVDEDVEVTSGLYTFVSEGSTQGSQSWVLITLDPITVGTTGLTFSQFSGPGSYLAGTGLTLTGNTFSIGNSQITLAMHANIADQTILGNNTGSSAAPLALSSSQVKTILSLGNVENTALSTWSGSANITTLGTVTSGKLSTGSKIGGVTMELGSDATGDLYYNNSGVLTRLPIGTNNFVLTSNGSSVSWAAVTTGAADAGTLTGTTLNAPVVNSSLTSFGTVVSGKLSTGAKLGGVTMELGSDATGDLYYRNSGGVLTRLGVGADTQILTLSSGLPVWSAPAASGISSGVAWGMILSYL